MFPVKLKQDHFTFSAGCIMSDHVLAPSIFPCSQRKEKKKKRDISKFSFSSGSSFPKLLNLGSETQSRDPATRGTEEHWDYEEAMPCCRRSHCKCQSSQERSKNFAELCHSLCSYETWTLGSIKEHKQKTEHNWSMHQTGCWFKSPLNSFSGRWTYCTCTSIISQFL